MRILYTLYALYITLIHLYLSIKLSTAPSHSLDVGAMQALCKKHAELLIRSL